MDNDLPDLKKTGSWPDTSFVESLAEWKDRFFVTSNIMKFILGKKIEMTQRFRENSEAVPVTVLAAGPCVVTQVKDKEKDGYNAVQLGFEIKRKVSKPLQGQLKGLDNFRYLREFRIGKEMTLKRGDKITVAVFKSGDRVGVTGVSKGKGFQGVVRRHGFAGSPASHGHKDQLRMPGSIGATDAARVFKGTRMAGQMGGGQATVKNLEVIEVDEKNNLLFIKGAVPGARHNLILISAEGEIELDTPTNKEESETVKENAQENKDNRAHDDQQKEIKKDKPKEEVNQKEKDK